MAKAKSVQMMKIICIIFTFVVTPALSNLINDFADLENDRNVTVSKKYEFSLTFRHKMAVC